MNIFTSKYSRKSAIALAEALGNSSVYNPYDRIFYHGSSLHDKSYNMGCSGIGWSCLNKVEDINACINKVTTLGRLKHQGVLTVPYTRNKQQAQEWLDEDRVVVNRTTIIGHANKGLHFSYKNIPDVPDAPLKDSVIWTRYVNHNRELRAYVFKGQSPLIFEKVDQMGEWKFKAIRPTNKLLEQVNKAQQAFSGLVFSAFDILECVTGDYYFLENNSAPSLLVHDKIIPTLKRTIENEYSA